MTQKPAVIAALLACAALPVPAFAAASASASLHDFSLTLVDLQYDFFGPSFGWIAEGANAQTQNAVSVADDGSYSGQYNVGFAGLLHPTSTTADFGPGLAHASAAFSGDGSFENYGLAVSGSAHGSTPGAKNEFRAATFVNYGIHFNFGNFVLGPQTQVTFSALSNVSVHTDSPTDEDATAGAFLSVVYQGQSNSDENVVCTKPLSEEPPGGCANFGQNLSFSELLSVTLSNPTNAPIVGTFYPSASVNGLASAVPEPATYGLFASGLAIVGLALRRRRPGAA